VINEKLAATMGKADPVGQVIRRGEQAYEIIGVVKDFHFQHLSNEIQPLLFMYNGSQRRLFVHLHSDAEDVIEVVQEEISDMSDTPVSASFISESRDKLYIGESQILVAVLFFTVLCILLSSLGLVGMVSHSAAERTREIALRKVFGAETMGIMISQNLKMFRMFLPATLLGGALAWFIMTLWLENYANRNGTELWVFILGPAIILLFSLLSISFQTWKASSQAPAISLKN